MRINNINSALEFGYNKELNDKVNKKLKNTNGNKEVANHLLELNQLCMKTEDLLRKAEKENNKRAKELYSHLLVNIKPTVTQQLNARFPLLEYRKTELESYKRERQKRNLGDEYHWLDEMADELSCYDNYEDSNFKDEWKGSGFKILGSVNKIEGKQVYSTANETECPDYLEKFEPTPVSPVGFSSIGGMEEIKELLEDKILFPLKNPEMAERDEIEYGKKYPRGTMFYGPPGCGKTTSIEALVAESGLPMYKLKVSKVGSKYVNQSSVNIQKAYEYVAKVAEDTGKPVFFVIDELESLAPKRSTSSHEDNKMVGTLLQIIEEARGKNVIILGATNKFDMIAEAIRSRFDDKIYVGLPDEETRKDVLKIHLNKRSKGRALAENDSELEKVVALTQGFSNRDIAILTDKASLIARKDNRRDIIAEDFVKPVQENQNMKVKEYQYKDKQSRPGVGFNQTSSLSFGSKIPNKSVKPDYVPDIVWEAEQELLNEPNDNSYIKLSESIWKGYIKDQRQLRPIMDYIANKIFLDTELSNEQMVSKINEAFRIYEKLLANNPPETVNKFNPIDMTTIVKVLLSELDCKDIKFEGLKNIENGYIGEQVLPTYYSLAELIKFAQTQCENKDITIKFEKPNALYTTLTYKGSAIDNKDLKKVLPKTYYYSFACDDEDNMVFSKNDDKNSLAVKMYTYDETFWYANRL